MVASLFNVVPQAGLRFKLENSTYLILKRLPGAKIEALDEQFNETRIFTYNELIKYLSEGLLRFEAKGKNTVKDSEKTLFTSFSFEDIENLKHKEQAIFRYEVIRPLLQVPYTQRTFYHITERAKEVNSWKDNPKIACDNLNGCTYYKTVSPLTVYRWVKNYEESNGDFRSLVPSYYKCGGKNKPRLHQKIVDYINNTIEEVYKDGRRITIKDLRMEVLWRIEEYNKYSSEKLTCPSLATFARYVSKIPEYELIAKRIGKRSADNQFAQVGNGVTVRYPLERVEIDYTIGDAILDEKGEALGRPYVIIAIDKLTGYPVGLSAGISNGVGWPEVMNCIKHIITDKSYTKTMYPFIENEWKAFGVPKTIVVDNGLEFKNKAMEDACYQLGFVLQYCPPKVPKWKGSIERFFGSLNLGLFHILPGTTRSNPTELGDDENPQKNACISFSLFLALLHKWVIDVYAQDLNKGVGGIPAKLWEHAIQAHPVAWPGDTSEIAILLGKKTYRKISRRGIELNALRYNSIELNRLLLKFNTENNGLNESFKVKYDPHDIGYLYVYDHLINKKWIKVPCTNPEYANGLSEWEHNEIRAYTKMKFGSADEIALARSKKIINNMIQNSIGYTKKHKARINRVNSTTEISKFMDEDNNAPIDPSLSDLLSERTTHGTNDGLSISDIGYSVQMNNIIVPKHAEASSQISAESTVVSIDNRSNKGRNKKGKKNNKFTTNDNKKADKVREINFSTADFSNFNIISSFLEERND